MARVRYMSFHEFFNRELLGFQQTINIFELYFKNDSAPMCHGCYVTLVPEKDWQINDLQNEMTRRS